MLTITLDLSNHCIQTEIKRQYNRRLTRLLGPLGGDDELEEQLDLLRLALQTFDFAGLRARHATLSGGRQGLVELDRGSHGELVLRLEGEIVQTTAND